VPDVDPTRYLEAVRLVGEAQRRLYDLLEDELSRRGHGSLRPEQAMMLWKLGSASMSAGALARKCYLRRNPSYNLEVLTRQGFLERRPDKNDKRSVVYRLTTAGLELRDLVDDIYARHAAALQPVLGFGPDALAAMNAMLRRLEGFWAHQLRYRA
jgi:DNA-binding MarR family transcriptional regulator